MKISYSWLKDFIDVKEDASQIAEVLTQTGLEVESLEEVEKIPGNLEGVVIGEIMSCTKHPNADKLKITEVNLGEDTKTQIVCGAPNVATGQKVLVATLGSTIYPTKGESFRIKKAKIRGEVSEGMICAEDELGLGKNHDGIMVLDTELPAGTPANQLYKNEYDQVFEIGLTPNRGDATSHLGTARDLKAYYKKDIVLPKKRTLLSTKPSPIQVRIHDTKKCPRYSGIYVTNIRVGDSPEWLQWKLRCIGLEPINNIVDITNYVLHGIGQPMHAFDADKIKGSIIEVKTLPDNTAFQTLDEKERKLHQDDLMICDGHNNGLCIAGVFGGMNSGISENTTNVFLESAYFSPDAVRATSQRHAISTDSSFRYERGTDPENTVLALEMACSLIEELAGGKIEIALIDHYPKPIKPVEIKVGFGDFDRLIGKKLSKEVILGILDRLDIHTEMIDDDSFTAQVPLYRSDVTRIADLVEEVLRIYGFNNIELEENPSASFLASFEENEPHKVQEEVAKFLAGKGFNEILTNSLTNPTYYEKVPLGNKPVEMLNPSSADLAILKTSPVYTALESIAYNINRRNPNLKFFEFGRTYSTGDKDYKEEEWLSIYQTGKITEENWMHASPQSTLHDLLSSVEAMLGFTGIRHLNTEPVHSQMPYSYGLILKHSGSLIATVGGIHADVLLLYNIRQTVFQAQIHWQNLLKNFKKDISFTNVPKFPEVKRDLSLVLSTYISYSQVKEVAFQQEKKYLTRMNLFSVYEGEKIEKGKKAYAISFFLQDKSKTLGDKQIEKSFNGLIRAFEEKLEALIRR
ncbi:MAG: phenylalanine--tRNA ligase subunit beta [Bacteroidota bacterium]